MTHVLDLDRARHPGPDHIVRRNAAGRVESAQAAEAGPEFEALGRELSGAIEGEVRFDRGSLALYATDASNYRQVPLGVVVPKTDADVVGTVALCRKHGAPIVLRGGGTSLAGQGCNVAVLIDFSKYLNRVKSIDPEARLAVVEPGCILDHLRAAAMQHQLTFGPDPATHDHNTLGGMLGNNSCGVHSVMAGRTSDNVRSLEILTYDGVRMEVGPTDRAAFEHHLAAGGREAEIFRALDDFRHRHRELILARYPQIPRRVSGYENLDQLFEENGFNVARALVGTEATCVTILNATLELVPGRPKRVLALVGFPDIFTAADAVPDVLTYGPIGLEGIDHELIRFIRDKHFHTHDLEVLPEGTAFLVVEFGASSEDEAMAAAKRLRDAYRAKGHAVNVTTDPRKQAEIWQIREAALAVTAHRPDTWPGWEDSAVPRDALGKYLREFKALMNKHGYDASLYGHFGDGLLHCSINFDLRTEAGIANWRSFLDEAADLVIRHGGSFSGEHGDGQARGELLEKMYGPELVRAFGEFKAIWDPEGRMNPGKIVDPYPITSNLRDGPAYQPADPEHYFAYPEDGGSFVQAMRRCVGVGECRRRESDEQVMCPSYMATNEEKYSTRGRARLLFEMLHGGPIEDRWKSDEVADALDYCFACKACKSDCPVNTDMATYKAEFRAHYYRGRLRPMAAYSMGLIRDWSRLAGAAPWLANFALGAPGLAGLAKKVGGIAPERSIPRYAKTPFTRWFRRRSGPRGGKRVMLFADTFNNYFRAETAIAATTLLERLGYEVVVPPRPVCCGRPLYDWGMLDKAKRLWRSNFRALEAAIAEGLPIVGLEPACVSAFLDELPGLFPGEERAKRLSGQMRFLPDFLMEDRPDAVPRLTGKALVQLHCHQHAIIRPNAEKQVLDRTGLDYEIMASGCCGMAGSFGFEADKYPVSVKAAERVMLPTIRAAAPEVSILANGFSCREQIEQLSGRPTRHIAELLAEAL